MTFITIVAVFFIWLLLAIVSTVASRFLSLLRPAYPYLWRISLWSSIGLFISSAVFVLPLLFGVVIFAESLQPNTMINMSLIGCSAGCLLGVIIGIVLAQRKILRVHAEKHAAFPAQPRD
jgi:membrane protein YqaA with SNARE-associated domain